MQEYVIYLLECTKCKIQYIGKAETEFNIRLITTEKMYGNQMLYLQAAIISGKNHNFNTHAKFMLTDQIRHVDIHTEKIKERLR